MPSTYTNQNIPRRQATKSLNNLDSGNDQLSNLMSQYGVDPNDDTDISELLGTLETADGMANGVEGKLDDILKNLDKLLESMERGQHDFVSHVFKPAPNSKSNADSQVQSLNACLSK
jgi:hypothetical protein